MTWLACFVHYRYTRRLAVAHLAISAGLIWLGHHLWGTS